MSTAEIHTFKMSGSLVFDHFRYFIASYWKARTSKSIYLCTSQLIAVYAVYVFSSFVIHLIQILNGLLLFHLYRYIEILNEVFLDPKFIVVLNGFISGSEESCWFIQCVMFLPRLAMVLYVTENFCMMFALYNEDILSVISRVGSLRGWDVCRLYADGSLLCYYKLLLQHWYMGTFKSLNSNSKFLELVMNQVQKGPMFCV